MSKPQFTWRRCFKCNKDLFRSEEGHIEHAKECGSIGKRLYKFRICPKCKHILDKIDQLFVCTHCEFKLEILNGSFKI